MPLARPGDLLQDNQNNSYRIDTYLGEGVTAEVYQATREGNNQIVALKILRPNLPPEIVQSFRDEAPTIGELVQYSRQRYPDEPLHVPRVFGSSQKPNSIEFMVMEFVSGQPLDDLIITTQGLVNNGREVEALLIARQVLQVLIVLHEDIRRSYSDFQLKNIWWLPEQSLVKVMDWNHVSVRAKEGDTPSDAVADLIRFGAYLYQLLTGQGAFQTGETEAELAERAGEKWARVSLGARTILLKALHPNLQNRFQTAREFLADIEIMLDMWQQDEDDLYDEANLALRQAKSRTPQSGSNQYTVTEYARAVFAASRAMNLFILRSRETRRIDRMREELDILTANISPIWGVGKNNYQLGVYSEALKQWEPEAKNLKRLDLWRWVVVAQISRQKASTLKDAYLPIRALLEEAIVHLDKQEWEQAKGTLTQIAQHGVSGPEFYAFGYEAEVQVLVKQAGDAEKLSAWNQARQAYVEAATTMRQIQDRTYLELLSGVLFTPEQLDEKATFCQRQEYGHTKESDVINEFRLRVAQNNEPVSYLIEQLIQNPSQPRLIDVVLEEAEKEDRSLELAIQLLSAAAFYGRAPATIFNRLAEKRTVQQQEIIEQYNTQLEEEYAAKAAAQQASYQGWIAEQTALLQQALQANQWEKVYTIVSDIGGDVPPETKQAILTTFETARKERNWPRILTLGDTLSLIYSGNEKAEIQQRLDDARKGQEIDLKLLQFNDQLLQGQFSAADASLRQMDEQINALYDLSERQRRHGKLATQRVQLDERKDKVVREVPIDQLIAALNQNELRDLSMNIKDNLQSINNNSQSLEEKLDIVILENKEREKRNEQLSNQSKDSKGREGGRVTTLGLLLLIILLIIGGGYLLKTTQIDPIATQVTGLAELPTIVADFQATQATQSATQIASMNNLSLTIAYIVQTQAAITPAPPMSPTPEVAIPTATPVPVVSDSLQISTVPAPTPDFGITEEDGSQISLDDLLPGALKDVDTVFDWPRFDLMLSNDWLFDLSGETVMLKHEGQTETLPLQIQMMADSMTETVPVDVMSDWVLSNTGGAEVATISIEGNSLKQEKFVPGAYTIVWLIPDTQSLFPSEPITYTPTITATWQTGNALRSSPMWDNTYDITKETLEGFGITGLEQDEVVNVRGYVCSIASSDEDLFMFLAIILNNDPEQRVYWLRNNITKEFATEQSDFQVLSNVFDDVEDCVNVARNKVVTSNITVPVTETVPEATAYP